MCLTRAVAGVCDGSRYRRLVRFSGAGSVSLALVVVGVGCGSSDGSRTLRHDAEAGSDDVKDAGRVNDAERDAAGPAADAGEVSPGVDASAGGGPTDAGTMPTDSGVFDDDAGSEGGREDAGVALDASQMDAASLPGVDGGAGVDGGTTALDSGSAPPLEAATEFSSQRRVSSCRHTRCPRALAA